MFAKGFQDVVVVGLEVVASFSIVWSLLALSGPWIKDSSVSLSFSR